MPKPHPADPYIVAALADVDRLRDALTHAQRFDHLGPDLDRAAALLLDIIAAVQAARRGIVFEPRREA